jgi:hypothetical protein
MNVGHPIIGFDIADRHYADRLRKAAEQRLIAEAHRGRPGRMFRFRFQLGNGLVRIGERLQAGQRRGIGEDLAGGALRLAR